MQGARTLLALSAPETVQELCRKVKRRARQRAQTEYEVHSVGTISAGVR